VAAAPSTATDLEEVVAGDIPAATDPAEESSGADTPAAADRLSSIDQNQLNRALWSSATKLDRFAPESNFSAYSGLIDISAARRADESAIPFASGPRRMLRRQGLQEAFDLYRQSLVERSADRDLVWLGHDHGDRERNMGASDRHEDAHHANGGANLEQRPSADVCPCPA
jgi:hypothetical protein